MAEAVDQELSWRGRGVDVDRIEAELTKLRYLATGGSAGGDGVAIRTSLANLVVHAEDESVADQARRVIEDLSEHHPSRALVIIASPSEDESRIDASLAAHCHMEPGMDQHVCCEEVTMRVSGRAAYHLRSIIVPLLIPDLPVIVWWTGALPDKSHLIEELCEVADHFVIDSARFSDQLGGLSRMRDLATLHNCAIGDLNYERVRSWRDIVQQYSGPADLAGWLTSVKSIEISYTDPGTGARGQAVLFLAWLCGRLGLDSVGAGSHGAERLTLAQDGRRVPIYLQPDRYEGVDRGWLTSVKLAFERDGETAFFAISRMADPLRITVRSELAGDVREDHVRIEACDSRDVLRHQLDTAPHDPEFMRLLIAATPLLEAARG